METMKTETKPAAAPPAPNKLVAELAQMDGLPVLELRFEPTGRSHDLALPDINGGSDVVRANKYRDITFLPKPMLYRVVQRSLDPKIKARTFYIPLAWATFEPIE